MANGDKAGVRARVARTKRGGERRGETMNLKQQADLYMAGIEDDDDFDHDDAYGDDGFSSNLSGYRPGSGSGR